MRLGRILLVVGSLLLVSGCGGLRFHHAWSGYAPSTQRSGMEGRWRGEWRSEWNGHTGGLRCLMTSEDAEHCRAWFYSTYAAVLFFQHEVLFHLRPREDGTLCFTGEQDLGQAIGGIYRYEGTVAEDVFRATYQAENGDHGVFELSRAD